MENRDTDKRQAHELPGPCRLPNQGTLRRLLAAGAAVALAAGASISLSAPVHAATTLEVDVGYGEGTVAGQAFGPGDLSVVVDDSVRFTITSDEVHTITFGDGPADQPPPNWPVSGWSPPAGPPPWDLGSVDYDGTSFLNTSIIVRGSTATVHFTAAGTFPFFCAIHPGMAGSVEVLEDGEATTQEEADEASQATSDELLGQVDGLRESRLDSTTSEEGDDGSKTWSVYAGATTGVGPMAGGGTGYLELLEFIPDEVVVMPGDTVSWTAAAVHTVTFLPEGETPDDYDPFMTPPSGDGTEYDPTTIANSGVFNVGPGSPASFSLTFPDEGTYAFYCLLHAGLGQIGEVMVTDLPPTDVPDPAAPAGAPLALLAAAALGGALWLVRRRDATVRSRI